MEKKSSALQKAEKFLSGKGFYIVLFACAAVIGASAWVMLVTGDNMENEEAATVGQVIQTVKPATVTEPEPEAVKPEIELQPSPSEKQQTAAIEEPNEDEGENQTEETAGHEENDEPVGYVWPVAGEIVKPYSSDELVYNKTMADWRTHPGVDISADIGTKVMAVAKGTVEKIVEDDLYGTTVIIDHGDGLKSCYCNMAETPAVNAGDSVAMGAVIGAVGDTAIGESVEVAHLHLAMTKDNEPVDPAAYLPER